MYSSFSRYRLHSKFIYTWCYFQTLNSSFYILYLTATTSHHISFSLRGSTSWILLIFYNFHLITSEQTQFMLLHVPYILYNVTVLSNKLIIFLNIETRGSPPRSKHIAYSDSKYHLRISLAHPQDCPFTHVQWLPLSTEKPQTPFREICVMFMFVPVR